MQPVTFAPGEEADLLLLVAAAAAEPAAVCPRVDRARAELQRVEAAGDFLVGGLVRIEGLARLVDVRRLHRLADDQLAAIGLLLADDHAEERGLAGAVRTDHADNAAPWQ